MIYLCATMWHETHEEMLQLITSIFRLEKDQWMNRLCHERLKQNIFRFEVHVFFDDAFEAGTTKPNTYVVDFRKAVQEASTRVYSSRIKLAPPGTIETPYGRQLHYKMRLGFKMVVHLKDKTKIRIKKRWSQVMYMYYLLSYKTSEKESHNGTEQAVNETGAANGMEQTSNGMGAVNGMGAACGTEIVYERKVVHVKEATKETTEAVNKTGTVYDNVYILALDGDVDFQPSALYLLVQRMDSNKDVGAACGRIHAIGSGPMVWYQKFEYAVSHWLQKATEHVTGSILCGPGCFTLFRGSALTDANVAKTYTSLPTEAKHYLQYDQGEDRWLCTLLLKQGKKLEYIAASDSYTFAPEGFKAFYKQRRRWGPSTMANILDLLLDSSTVTKKNSSITWLYMAYQLFLFITSVLTPGTIFLMVLGATKMAYPSLPLTWLLVFNLVPVGAFVLACLFAESEIQLKFASVLSVAYSILMIIVLVGLVQQGIDKGACSLTIMFIMFVGGVFVTTALLHPKEWSCVAYGLLYFLVTPSMQMLLIIYSITNLNNVSWGTRESASQNQHKEGFLDKLKRHLGSCCMSGTEPTSSIEERIESGENRGISPSSESSDPIEVEAEIDEIQDLDEQENEFWKEVISKYLQPVGSSDEKRELKAKKDLLNLRNKVTLAFLLMNAIFVTVVFFLQKMNEDADRRFSVPLPCGSGEDIEPIGLAFTFVFGIMLLVQYVCMLAHRWKTFLVIMANASLLKKGTWNTLRDILDNKFKSVSSKANEDLGKVVIESLRNDDKEGIECEQDDTGEEHEERSNNRNNEMFLQSTSSRDFHPQNQVFHPPDCTRLRSARPSSSRPTTSAGNQRPKSARQKMQKEIERHPNQLRLIKENSVVCDILNLH